MTKAKGKKQTIVLGSGRLYSIEFEDTIPEHTVIETRGNLLGHIQGGASLSYNFLITLFLKSPTPNIFHLKTKVNALYLF